MPSPSSATLQGPARQMRSPATPATASSSSPSAQQQQQPQKQNETFEERQRRQDALAVLDSPEQLMMYAQMMNDSIPGQRYRFMRTLCGFSDEDEEQQQQQQQQQARAGRRR
ncbi:hypothetical protein CRV24_000256 [Beauveria bassiana]|nr:hypothetical protein CRV24_000256 [Beauveria bassiana]KAH8721224.1 hypothetical protein HC256_001584 [Beauveria bassiana]